MINMITRGNNIAFLDEDCAVHINYQDAYHVHKVYLVVLFNLIHYTPEQVDMHSLFTL